MRVFTIMAFLLFGVQLTLLFLSSLSPSCPLGDSCTLQYYLTNPSKFIALSVAIVWALKKARLRGEEGFAVARRYLENFSLLVLVVGGAFALAAVAIFFLAAL